MNTADAHYIKMTETPVTKLVISLGIPTTISMLITSIYNMADTYFVGTLGKSAQAAMPVTHKEVSNGHWLCIAGMIKYCSKKLLIKLGGITMKSIFEQNGGTYTKVGHYYIPNVSVPGSKKYNIGKYGRMHAKFLKQNKPYIYSAKMLNGTWLDYLEEIDNIAREIVDKTIQNLAVEQGITEELKVKDQFAWISAMGQIKHIAEEIVFSEYIFAESVRKSL